MIAVQFSLGIIRAEVFWK